MLKKVYGQAEPAPTVVDVEAVPMMTGGHEGDEANRLDFGDWSSSGACGFFFEARK